MNSLYSASDSHLLSPFLSRRGHFSPKLQLPASIENKRADQILGICYQGNKDLSSFLVTNRKIASFPEKKLEVTFLGGKSHNKQTKPGKLNNFEKELYPHVGIVNQQKFL